MSLFKKVNNPDAVTHLLLKELGIRANAGQIIAELEKHPNYPNLAAVGDVLNALNAPNDAYHVPFDELSVVPTPFIAHAPVKRDDFVVVHQLGDQSVTVSNNLWNRHRLDLSEFKKMYQGVVLVAQKGERPITPAPANADPLARLRLPIALVGFAAILFFAVLVYTPWLTTLNWPLGLLTLAKTLGLVTSALLLVQSIDRNNPLVQKICGGGANAIVTPCWAHRLQTYSRG
jgi:ABC-type bacteriocin/lantibiotic exporter with double-glycine peptidase domain